MPLTIDFCGQVTEVERGPFAIGRDADLVLDADNRHLHRRFLTLTTHTGLWLITNTGSLLSATVADGDGRLQAYLAPGATLPVVFATTAVSFTAGPTSYEFSLMLPEAAFTSIPGPELEPGVTTVGRVAMTPDQFRLILALAEPVLRGAGKATTAMPTNLEVARRLGWTVPRFNRKLDHLCQKLTARGVRGLHGGPGRLASSRRARLVEYALAVQLVTAADLALLDQEPA